MSKRRQKRQQAEKDRIAAKGPTRKGAIPVPDRPPIDRYVLFSFKYLDLDHNPKFSLRHGGSNYPVSLLGQLRTVSAMELGVFKQAARSLHSHQIAFEETTEDGFSLDPQLWLGAEWQFATGTIARVHGFIVKNVFHVIWLDPAHKLYRLTSRG